MGNCVRWICRRVRVPGVRGESPSENTDPTRVSASQTPHAFHRCEWKRRPSERLVLAHYIITSTALTARVSAVGEMMSLNFSAHLSPLPLSSKWASSASFTKISLRMFLNVHTKRCSSVSHSFHVNFLPQLNVLLDLQD